MKTACLVLTALLLTSCALPGPNSGPAGAGANRPLVLAHYMPWFRAEKSGDRMIWEHWQWTGNGPRHDPNTVLTNGHRDISSVYYPLIGPYDGRDRAVLEYHLLTAKAAGIDGFVADWYGPDTYTDQVFAELLAAAERCGMGVAICLEEKAFFPPYTPAATRADVLNATERHIRRVTDRYAASASYLRRDNRPLVFLFSASGDSPLGPVTLAPKELADVLSRFSNNPVFFMREHFEPGYAGIARGNFAWCGDAAYREWFYRTMRDMKRDGKVDFSVGAASPGFDDTGVWGWGNGPRVTDRRGTLEFETNWIDVIHGAPDAVQIVTWNDFEEGTTIEPAESYGFAFVDLAEQYAGRFSGRAVNTADNAWPLRLYRLRLAVRTIEDRELRRMWTAKLDSFSDAFSSGRRFLMGWRLNRLEKQIEAVAPPRPAE